MRAVRPSRQVGARPGHREAVTMLGAVSSARSVVGALARKASYTAGMFGGLFTMALSPSPFAWRRSRRLQLARRPGALVARSGGFAELRVALFGSSKSEVVDTLGSPPAAAVGVPTGSFSSAAFVSPGDAFWHADTWYYLFDPRRQAAVAVQFHRDRVVRVEFIGGLS